jgi:hypothetical protein
MRKCIGYEVTLRKEPFSGTQAVFPAIAGTEATLKTYKKSKKAKFAKYCVFKKTQQQRGAGHICFHRTFSAGERKLIQKTRIFSELI